MNEIDEIISCYNDVYVGIWAVVDIENNFKYDNYIFHISDELEQYKVYDIPQTNKAKMDKVLIIAVNNKMLFFDQNLNKINNNDVKLVL